MGYTNGRCRVYLRVCQRYILSVFGTMITLCARTALGVRVCVVEHIRRIVCVVNFVVDVHTYYYDRVMRRSFGGVWITANTII